MKNLKERRLVSGKEYKLLAYNFNGASKQPVTNKDNTA